MKKRAIFILTAMIVLIGAAPALAYVGNSHSMKFHYDDCRWVNKISAANRVYLDSRDEAAANGYIPCQVCRP